MLCVMMLPLVVVGCTSAARQASVKLPRLRDTGSLPRLADTAERDYYFTLRERLITMQKQLEGTPGSILMSSADKLAHIDGATLCNYVSNSHNSSASIKCLLIKLA